VAIGGLDLNTSHGKWCLTSPAIDTTSIAGDVWVTFWRHLHSPAEPLVRHSVEVYNGMAWVELEGGYPAEVDDAAWTFKKYNAGELALAEFRLRVCTERMAGAANFAGWSVDDVTVAGVACTP
jgi:hypothetical protein